MGYRWPYLTLISIHRYVMEWWDVLPFSIFCESDQTLGEYVWWILAECPPADILCRHVQWTAERVLTFTSGWRCVNIWFLLEDLWGNGAFLVSSGHDHVYVCVCAAAESLSSNRLCLIIINGFINALHAERALSHQLQAFIISWQMTC